MFNIFAKSIMTAARTPASQPTTVRASSAETNTIDAPLPQASIKKLLTRRAQVAAASKPSSMANC